jgi:hypothetical protein
LGLKVVVQFFLDLQFYEIFKILLVKLMMKKLNSSLLAAGVFGVYSLLFPLNNLVETKLVFFEGRKNNDDQSKALERSVRRVTYDSSRASVFSEAIDSLGNYNNRQYLRTGILPSVSSNQFEHKASPVWTSPGSNSNPRSNRREFQSTWEFFYPNQDPFQGVLVPQNLISNSHSAVLKQFVKLARVINDKDRNVRIGSFNLTSMFLNHHDDYFNVNYKQFFNRDPSEVPYKRKRKKLVAALSRQPSVFRNAKNKLQIDLFCNPNVLKLSTAVLHHFARILTYFSLNMLVSLKLMIKVKIFHWHHLESRSKAI